MSLKVVCILHLSMNRSSTVGFESYLQRSFEDITFSRTKFDRAYSLKSQAIDQNFIFEVSIGFSFRNQETFKKEMLRLAFNQPIEPIGAYF